MIYTPLFVLIVMYFTFGALEEQGTYFEAIQNKKSISNVTDTYDCFTATECAVHCVRKPGCSTMNFKADNCELLNEAFGNEFQLADESDWTFLCKQMSFDNHNTLG